MTAVATMTSFAALGAHFFARQLSVVIGVEARELRDAAGVELGPRQHAVIVGVGLKDAVPAAGVFGATLRNRNTSKTCRQNRSARRR